MASRSWDAAVFGGKRYDLPDGAPVFEVRRDASMDAMFCSCDAREDMAVIDCAVSSQLYECRESSTIDPTWLTFTRHTNQERS